MWKIGKLGDVCKIQSGNSIPVKEKEVLYKNAREGLPYIATKDVGFDGVIDYENGIRIPSKHSSKFKFSKKNSILVCSEGGSAGRKIAFSNKDCHFVNKLFSINPGSEMASKYIYYYALSDDFQNQFKKAMHGLIGGVSLSKIKGFQINYPSISEQKRIVAKLDAAFAEIDKLIKINFSKLNYIDVVTNSILNNKMGNNLIKLNKACDLIKRGISPKYLETGGICVINQKCIRNHKIDFSKARRHNINLKKIPEERFIRKGDVLINSTGQGTLGRVAQVSKEPLEKTTVDTHVTIVRPKQNLFNPNFFGNSLIKIEKQLQAAGEGTSGQTELPRARLVNEFFVPYVKSIDEQKKIAHLLNLMFKETFTLKNLTTKIIENQKSLKKSILYKEFNNKAA